MSNKRIDLTYFEGITENRGAMNYEIDENGMVGNVLGIDMNQKDAAAIYNIPRLIAELKRCYEREDALIEALRIIRDDLDDALETEGYNTSAHEKSERTLQKIRNFANDASE